ncbi:MAG: aconitate hydratase [Candidatus Hydrogenedentota bacterium]
MALSVTEKIIRNHIVSGEPVKGQEIGLKIDQTLTQDATGTMAYLQFEAIGIPKVKTELSVSYIDHNTLQTGFENADDHLFLQTIAKKYGVYFSKPGNGICHQVHLERFGIAGKTLLGSDSHTPTAGGIGMLAIGVGGLDIALAMAGMPFYLKMPEIVNIRLTGRLNEWSSAKDIILEVLRRLSVKGGVGKIFEYTGSGVNTLSVPQRATITNMGAELGATSSIFPSDKITYDWLSRQNREKDFVEILPDDDARYDATIEINLSEIEPLIACPHSPDNVKPVREVTGTKINQILIGSCTNSSFSDIMTAVKILEGNYVHPEVSFALAPGSRQVLMMLAKNGGLKELYRAGARVLETACGPCIGMGLAPNTNGISLRTFNRNFEARSGTKSAQVYLVSVETACASALTGVITDPRTLGKRKRIKSSAKFLIDDSMIISPAKDEEKIEIIRGPNIAPLPVNEGIKDNFIAKVILKVQDNITTDHIMPAGAKVLPLRSNIPKIAEFVYSGIDTTFYKRALETKGQGKYGIIIGGENYGQGSSREHAALAPMYLGIKAIIAKSFARIHRDNLINFGIIPLVFENSTDYEKIDLNDELEFNDMLLTIDKGKIEVLSLKDKTRITLKLLASDREKTILKAGGKLNYIRDVPKNG